MLPFHSLYRHGFVRAALCAPVLALAHPRANAEATIAMAELSSQARIVHVIGTTGISEDGEAKIRAASRHARIIKSGNIRAQ
jgi:hypothetical protein